MYMVLLQSGQGGRVGQEGQVGQLLIAAKPIRSMNRNTEKSDNNYG